MNERQGNGRIRSACDNCHFRKLRCSSGAPCVNCYTSGQECCYSLCNPIGRPKGTKNKRSKSNAQSRQRQHSGAGQLASNGGVDHDGNGLGIDVNDEIPAQSEISALPGDMMRLQSHRLRQTNLPADATMIPRFYPFSSHMDDASSSNASLSPAYSSRHHSRRGSLTDATTMKQAHVALNTLDSNLDADWQSLLTHHTAPTQSIPIRAQAIDTSATTTFSQATPASSIGSVGLMMAQQSFQTPPSTTSGGVMSASCDCLQTQANLSEYLRQTLSRTDASIPMEVLLKAVQRTLATLNGLVECPNCLLRDPSDEAILLASLSLRKTLQLFQRYCCSPTSEDHATSMLGGQVASNASNALDLAKLLEGPRDGSLGDYQVEVEDVKMIRDMLALQNLRRTGLSISTLAERTSTCIRDLQSRPSDAQSLAFQQQFGGLESVLKQAQDILQSLSGVVTGLEITLQSRHCINT